MRSTPPWWVDPLMRVGYIARGIVYVLVGFLAFMAAVDGGQTPDSRTALGTLLDQPFGDALLLVIALGLLAYSLWQFINAAMDLDDKGREAKGWAARGAQFISGAVHLALGISVAGLALGRGGSGNGADHWTAVMMQQPFGRWLVAIVGGVVIAIGAQHFVKAYQEKYKDTLRYAHATERLDPIVKFGLAAHGLVVLIVGGFFLWAAWTANPSRAGGLREALQIVRDTGADQILLAIVGIGLIGFSVYCFIEAAFRIVPRCAPKGLETLASKARALMRESGV